MTIPNGGPDRQSSSVPIIIPAPAESGTAGILRSLYGDGADELCRHLDRQARERQHDLRLYLDRTAAHGEPSAPQPVPHVGTLQEQLAKAMSGRQPEPLSDAELDRLLITLESRPDAARAILRLLRRAARKGA